MTSGGLSTAYHVVLSLAIVIAVVIVAARFARRAGIKGPGAGLQVLDRAGLSKESSVAVVAVGDRRLVVGVSPHAVTLLTELDPTPADAGDGAPVAAADAVSLLPQQTSATDASATTAPTKPATGSVLSPSTWKQGVEALRELTTRKG